MWRNLLLVAAVLCASFAAPAQRVTGIGDLLLLCVAAAALAMVYAGADQLIDNRLRLANWRAS